MPAYEGSYGGTLEEQCRQWIEEVTGEALEWDEGAEHGALWGALKSGVALCALLNRLAPGTVKRVSASEMPFPQRENVQAFCDGCKALGVPPQDGFTTVDLFEGKNMRQVTICLSGLGRQAYEIPGWEGPCLGRAKARGTESGFVVKQDGLWGKAGGQFRATAGASSVR